MDEVFKRLNQFREVKGLTARDFERLCKLGNGTFAAIGEKTRSTTLNRISNAFPDLNINWVKTGEGEMLKPIAISQEATGHHINQTGINNASPEASEITKELVDTLRSELQAQRDEARAQREETRAQLQAQLSELQAQRDEARAQRESYERIISQLIASQNK